MLYLFYIQTFKNIFINDKLNKFDFITFGIIVIVTILLCNDFLMNYSSDIFWFI